MAEQTGKLILDREVGRRFLAALFQPQDIIQVETYPKPARTGQDGPGLRLSFAAGELNERVFDQVEAFNSGPRYESVYVRTNPLRQRLDRRSGKETDIAIVRNLWMDLDEIQPDAVATRIRNAGWPDAQVIQASGGTGRAGNPGCQAWFRLAQPVALPIETEAAGAWMKEIIRALHIAMGDKLPGAVAKLNTLMRWCGTWNCKHPAEFTPRPTRLLVCQDETPLWTIDEWAKMLGVKWDPAGRISQPAARVPANTAGPRPQTAPDDDGPPALLAPIYAQCAWLRHCRDDAASLLEPEWHAAASIIGRCQDGRAAFHEFSKPYPRYNADETDAKLDHALKYPPRTCQDIFTRFNHGACQACQHWQKITTPKQLGNRARRRPTEATAISCKVGILQRCGEHEPHSVLVEVLETLPDLEQLAWLWKNQRGHWLAFLDTLKTQYGEKGPFLKALEEAVERVATERAQRDRQRARQQKDDAGVKVCEVLKGAPVAEDHCVPAPFLLSEDGLRMEKWRGPAGTGDSAKEFVSATPMLITGILSDVHTGEQSLQLAFRLSGGRKWRQVVIPRAVAANSMVIIEPLASVGCGVHSKNKLDIIAYLAAYEARNADVIPRAEYTQAMGWQPGGRFLIGRRVIDKNGTREIEASGDPRSWGTDALLFRPGSAGEEALLEAYDAGGTWEDWLKAVEAIEPYPLVQCGIYAALASVMMKLLRVPSLIFEWASRTSTGKTIALKIATSTCGNPDESAPARAITEWSTTINAVLARAGLLGHLPVLVDDTAKARDKLLLKNVIYDYSAGQERGRKTVEKGTRGLDRPLNWQSTMLSTGEEPMTDFSVESEGSKLRVLSVWKPPWGTTDLLTAQLVQHVEAAVERNYGHALPRFVAWIIAHLDELPTWQTWMREAQSDFERRCHDEGAKQEHLASRMARNLAVIQVTATLAHEALPLPWEPPDFWATLGPSVRAGMAAADTARVALNLLLQDAAMNRAAYYDGRLNAVNKEPPQGRWRGRRDSDRGQPIYFADATVRDVLGRANIDPGRMARLWRDNGWIQCDRDGRHMLVRMDVPNLDTRLLCVPAHVIDDLLGGKAEEPPKPPAKPEQRGFDEMEGGDERG